MRIATVALTAALMPLWGQQFKLPENLERLSEKAQESVEVTLDKAMLRLTSRFLDRDEVQTRRLIEGLDRIYVRNFEFAGEGEYNLADVAALRAQLQAPGWSRIVGVRCKRSGQNVDVYFKDSGNGQLGGIMVIDAEPRELTIVNIVGTIDPDRLADIGGEFGIPRLDCSSARRVYQ
jgi:Domain of unknown function (DUF4252)